MVKEEEPAGTRVIQVHAEDRDPLDSGGTFLYNFFHRIINYPLHILLIKMITAVWNIQQPFLDIKIFNYFFARSFSHSFLCTPGTITYSFITAPGEKLKFDIDNKTGLVRTTQVLDRDEPAREKEAYLTILATDNGRPQLDDVCTFKVTIADVNDNSPVFDKVVSIRWFVSESTFYSIQLPFKLPSSFYQRQLLYSVRLAYIILQTGSSIWRIELILIYN